MFNWLENAGRLEGSKEEVLSSFTFPPYLIVLIMWIIDFEASGLSKQSYPIEVGLCSETVEYQALIKPMPHWSYWSDDAESIHNISRSKLESEGIDPTTVAYSLNRILSGQVVYCDALQWDSFWCNALFSDTGIHQAFELRDIQELIGGSENHLRAFINEREKLEDSDKFTVHRALDDAKIIRKALKVALAG
ncbi:hypothetical protein ACJJIL_10075 [Microbulbifer sp. EKSA005]|uniref:hypothetical protein n=1 Tax=Microbulbifer sp. EKSA005 TaxID=3243364 RepID=UPI0040410658